MRAAVVSGALANKPGNAGNAWTRLQWVLGLRRFGFDVAFVEQIRRRDCVAAGGLPARPEESVNVSFFRRVAEAFGLGGAAALVIDDGRTWGLSAAEVQDVVGAADLLVNIGGHLTRPDLMAGPRVKAYVDDDPGYTQFWHAAGTGATRLEGHDRYFTYGANVGSADCPIPTCGVRWLPLRPPVVLDQWPAAGAGKPGSFTTVATWRGPYGRADDGTRTYGQKLHEFRRVIDLPGRTGLRFEIALDIHPAEVADLALLRRHGWGLADPRVVVPDPGRYRRYIQASGAEFSSAQGVYAETHSGWFSDRTACYLAAGRPVVVQDTGFARHVPTGEGLVTFRTPDEAAAAVGRVARDYDRHRRAARVVAEQYFDSDRVLARFLDACSGPAGRRPSP
jgi:hypothetical protein